MLREQGDQPAAPTFGPAAPPAGEDTFQGATAAETDTPLVKQLDAFAKTLRAKFKTKYPGVYIHHCTIRENGMFVIGFAATGVDDKMLSTVAREIELTPGLPGNVKFVPGAVVKKISELDGRTWRIMKEQGKGEQKAIVARTNMSAGNVGTLWGAFANMGGQK